ncbi:MAG: DUF4384 domain-containing protein [Pseudomonadota bacterium]
MASARITFVGLHTALAALLLLGAADAGALAQEEKPRVNIRLGADGADVETLQNAAEEAAQDLKKREKATPDAVKVVTTDPEEIKSVTEAVTKPEVFPAPDPLKGLIPVPRILEDARSCTRQTVSSGDIEAAVLEDLKSVSRKEANGTRYLSLAPLYNSCVDDETLARHRAAAVKLLNSLTWEPRPVTPKAVGPHGLLLRFRLSDLGWGDKQWGQVLISYPYAVQVDQKRYKAIWNRSRSIMPYVRADWLAFTASRPPLYYRLLKLPAKLDELKSRLGVARDRKGVSRSGFQLYGVKNASRVLERHRRKGGVFWQTFEFSGLEDRQDLFKYPLGPGGKDRFSSIGGTAHFSLPNGFKGWFIHNQAGRRINGVPLRNASEKDWRTFNGFYCASCNFSPLVLTDDRVRIEVIGNPEFSAAVQDRVRKTHPRPDYLRFLFERDQLVYAQAMTDVDLEPEVAGAPELIQALADHYQGEGVTLQMAAGEVGLALEDFESKLVAEGPKAFNTARTMAQRGLSRVVFETKFPVLSRIAEAGEPIRGKLVGRLIGHRSTVAKPRPGAKFRTGPFRLSLVSNKSRYKVGDSLKIGVQTNRECALTLIFANRDGSGTVIFPNKFRSHPIVSVGRDMEIPGGPAPFEFKLNDPGEETVIALCDGSRSRSGLRHNFDKAPFTKIESVRKLLEKWISKTSKSRKRGMAYTALRLPVEP